MFGKHAKLKLLGGVAIAASLAVLALPSALAHTVPVQRPTLQSGLLPDVAQAIQAGGFVSSGPQSGGLLPSDTTVSWGAAIVGICIGAGLMLLFGGPRRPV